MPQSFPDYEELENDINPPARPTRRSTGQNGSATAAPRRRPVQDSSGPSNSTTAYDRPGRPRCKRSGIAEFLSDVRTHLVTGIVLCLVSTIMCVSAVSYFLNFEADQSATAGTTLQQAADEGVATWFGAIGAKLAQVLLVNTFGISSLALALYIFILGYAILANKKIQFFPLTFRYLFTTVALSIILGLVSYNSSMPLSLGGNHGHYINALVLQYSDALGAYVLSLLLAALLVVAYLFPIMRAGRWLKTKFSRTPAPDAAPADDSADPDPDNEELAQALAAVADSDDNSTDDTVSPTTANADHSRFMPPAEIENFGDSDDAADAGDTDTPGEPEMVVVNDSLLTGTAHTESMSPRTIHVGGHTGLGSNDITARTPYTFPTTDLLQERERSFTVSEEEKRENKEMIVNALRNYDVEIVKIQVTIGPTVTLYEIVPAPGTRISRIKSLEDDIAMSLSALGIRIIAPIPGKGTIGLEVPNRNPQTVSMRSILESDKFRNNNMSLPLVLGSTIANDIFMVDLAKMPHLLVAGATGQGKSVGLNCIITSLLYSRHPDELKFVLIDPKKVEFSLYSAIEKQYMAKIPGQERAVITDVNMAVDTLNSLCVEMDQRYALLQDAGVRNVAEYNRKFNSNLLSRDDGHRFLPYIVVIVDEYADLVMTADSDIAKPICRIAQLARAVGMHMIIATQRPSTDIITGKIKANFPARIAFKVSQSVDSKTILDRPGAQKLIGAGDMLVMTGGTIERVQCAFVDTPEVETICTYVGSQPGFPDAYKLPDPPSEEAAEASAADINVTDEFRKCAIYISTQQLASITMLQRKFEIGFNKAGRFMDQMQRLGIVGPANGAKPRQVIMSPEEVERILS